MRPREAGPGQDEHCYVAEGSGILPKFSRNAVLFCRGNSGEFHYGLPSYGDFFGFGEDLFVAQMLDFLADDFDFVEAIVALFLKD